MEMRVERPRIDRPGEGFQPHRGHVDIVGERMADDFRLLVDLLGHEVPVIALLGEQASGKTALDAPLHRSPDASRMSAPSRRSDDPVAFLEIGDAVGERRERQRVGAEVHFAVAIADRERRALCAPRSRDCPRPQTDRRARRRRAGRLSATLNRLGRRACRSPSSSSTTKAAISESVSVANEWPFAASSSRSALKFSMMPLWTTASPREACGCALVSVGLPCVAQRVWPMPIEPESGAAASFGLEVLELALGAPAFELSVLQRRDARQIVAAVFEALKRVDDRARDRPRPQNADNSAHPR